jgi:hypothetical protein
LQYQYLAELFAALFPTKKPMESGMKKCSSIFMLRNIVFVTSCLFTSYYANAASFYVDGINDFESVDPGYSTDPMKESTYLYTPGFSYELSKVEFYTDSGDGAFTVRIRESLNGVPSNILAETTFQLSGESGFQGIEFSSPLSLSAGNDYWIGFYGEFQTGSHFSSEGILVTEYASETGIDGIWTYGPDAWLRPMMKFYTPEVPIPGAIWLFSSALVGLAGIKLRPYIIPA